MREIIWTEAEVKFSLVNLSPTDGVDTCPNCHGRGTFRQRNYATLSPSDDFDVECSTCGGEGEVRVIDNRYV